MWPFISGLQLRAKSLTESL